MNFTVSRVIFFLSILSMGLFVLDTHAQSGLILTGSSDQTGVTLSGGMREIKTNTGVISEESSSGSSSLSEKEKGEIREAVNELVTSSMVRNAKRAVENFSDMVEKNYPSDEGKIAAYERIKNILIARISKIEENKNLRENGKAILRVYLETMIKIIDTKVEELK